MKKIWGLDIFRGIAAMLVFCFHFWTFYPDAELGNFLKIIFSAGHLGVDIFFVLSGFLVSLSLFRYCNPNHLNPPSKGEVPLPYEGGLEGVALKKYFSARIRRIIPLAIFVTVVFFIAKKNFSPENFADFFAHLFFIHGFFSEFYHGINPVMWTLSVEMLFYIFLPILYVFLARKNFFSFLSLSFFLVILSFIWRAVVFYYFSESSPQEKIFLSEQLWGRFDQFFLGIILAVIVCTKNTHSVVAVPCACPNNSSKGNHKGLPLQKNNSLFVVRNWLLIFLGTVLLGYSFYTFSVYGSGFREIFWMQVFLHSLVGLGFFLFLLGFINMITNEKKKNWVLAQPLLFLGEISYGIYLFHFPVLSVIAKKIENPWFGFFGALGITIFISWISWEFFEKKFLQKKILR